MELQMSKRMLYSCKCQKNKGHSAFLEGSLVKSTLSSSDYGEGGYKLCPDSPLFSQMQKSFLLLSTISEIHSLWYKIQVLLIWLKMALNQ